MVEAVQQLTGAEEIVWNLGDLYAASDDPKIETDLAEVRSQAERFAGRYRGRVAALGVAELAGALAEYEQLGEMAHRLLSFATLQWTTETTNPAYGALLQRLREAASEIEQKTLFFDLEWANIPAERMSLAQDPALARWRHYLENALKTRPYLLSEPEEKILSEKALTGVAAWTRYFGQLTSAARFDLDGEKLPQEMVLRKLYLPDRELRHRAADSVTAGLRQNLPHATFIMNTVLADKASDDKLRKYPTWISSRNLANETTDQAVEALIQAVTGRYDIVARYYAIKRRLLGYDSLFEYDRFAPLGGAESRYSWNQAREVVLKAFNAFHPRMAEIAGEFFEKRWIHAPVRPGKRGGAFASPAVPSAHPYVFVNFTGLGRDVMTLAHELGHGVHMYLSRPKGILAAGTPLTTAEMASVFGEMLVFNDMMAREPDPAVRLSMLARKIEDSFGTCFRQVSMNRFEHAVHTSRRTEGELATDRLNELWLETQRAVFGQSVTLREEYGVWWSYIPHFLNTPGYVYAYAFGELLVLALFNLYQQRGATFAPGYLEVLAAGGSDSPENVLAKVGIDLTDPNFWQQGLATIDRMVTQLDELATSTR